MTSFAQLWARAAIKMQASFRGSAARERIAPVKRRAKRRKERHAAKERKARKRRRRESPEWRAAVRIQRQWRRGRWRKLVARLRSKKRKESYAIYIYKVFVLIPQTYLLAFVGVEASSP